MAGQAAWLIVPLPSTILLEIMTNFRVKCFSPAETLYECEVPVFAEAVTIAHLLAEVYGFRANVYKPGEIHHCYAASGNPDVTDRRFT